MEDPTSSLAVPKLRSLKGRKTRRYHGRRAVTPMRRRHHRHTKTRAQPRVGNENGKDVQLSQRTASSDDGERKDAHEDADGGYPERKGTKDGDLQGERKDQEEHSETDGEGGGVHSEVSVHPGSLQELRELPASIPDANETSLEEEEPPF